ncbi:hypothetical protein IKF03_01375 [Candidatus Saccharibacteria bacterium]|nr:hypothetical protein [Candidatus Saccharibacteria bacterium]
MENDEQENITGKNKNKKVAMAVGATVMIVIIIAVAAAALLFAIPIAVMATIDYGLQRALGFDETSAVIEKQAEYVVASQLKRGYFNETLAADFEKHGVEVGQTTLVGEFVRTNNYSAELETEVASDGVFYDHSTGELAMRFEGEIIVADDFVAKVESNPRLYAAFALATDMTSRFYYSDDVNKVYKEFGLSRNNFASWKTTGSIEGDQEQFEKIFDRIIRKVSSVGLNGCDEDCKYDGEKIDEECAAAFKQQTGKDATIEDCPCKTRSFTTEERTDANSGAALATMIGGNVQGERATEKAVSLLNTAVSANEPYIAAATFSTLEEGLNVARIDSEHSDLVDPLLNTFTQVNTVTVTDVKTGANKTTTNSLIRTPNFLATVLNRSYSVSEAADYSRDRILEMSGGAATDIINRTTMATNANKRFNVLIRMKEKGNTDERVLRASNSLATTFYDDTYELTKSTIGGERTPMGGSFLSNNINSRVLAAAPSDAEAVLGYKEVVDEVFARRAAADRATLSPFDISSKHTFLGSLAHKFGVIAVQNFARSGSSAGTGLFNSVADLFKESVQDLTSNTVLAEAEESYLTTNGNCPTAVTAAGVVGDMYCTTHNTIDTSRMGQTKEALGSMLAGLKVSMDELRDLAMGRQTTVGIQDAVICEKWKEKYGGPLGKISALLSNLLALDNACESPIDIPILGGLLTPPPEVAIGSKYTISSSNQFKEAIEVFSAYTLLDTVSALLDEKKSDTAIWKEEYEAKYPQDNSREAILARRSGMSREDAEIALGYMDYMDYLARYNPEERYAFVKVEPVEFRIDILTEDKDFYDMLALLTRRSLYRDLRNSVTFSA